MARLVLIDEILAVCRRRLATAIAGFVAFAIAFFAIAG
jgi:hypothetical protein